MKPVDIQFIRNATLKIKYNRKTILVDPMFSPKHSFMSFVEPDKMLNPTVDLPHAIDDIIQDVDMLLVTHLHPDHFDPAAINALDFSLPTFVQPCDEETVKEAGFTQVNAIQNTMDKDGITLSRTTGHHGPKEILEHLGEVSGFVLQAEDYPTIYIVGDCIWADEIQKTIERYKPNIIMTNSGGAVFMGEHKILMDAQETIAVAKAAPNAKLIATHMESLDHCMTKRAELLEMVAQEQVNVLVPKDGETIIV